MLAYPNVPSILACRFWSVMRWCLPACAPEQISIVFASGRENGEGEEGGREGTGTGREESGKRHCRVITCREPLAHSAVHCEWLRMPDHHGTLEKGGRRSAVSQSLTDSTNQPNADPSRRKEEWSRYKMKCRDRLSNEQCNTNVHLLCLRK